MLQRLGRFLAAIFWPFAIYAFVLVLDPLGLYSATYTASRDLAFRVLSLFRDEEAARAVSLILLDDHSADEINGELGYPITFRNHAEIVQSVLCRGPGSLFIDFTFRNVRTRNPADVVQRGERTISADLDQLASDLRTRPTATSAACPPLTLDHGRRTAAAPRVYIARTRSVAADGCDALFENLDGKPLPERCKASRQIAVLGESAIALTIARNTDANVYAVAVKPSETFAHPPADADQRLPIEPSPALAAVLAYCRALPAETATRFKGCRDIARLEELVEADGPDVNRRLVPLWSYFHAASVEGPLPAACRPEQDRATSKAMLIAMETAHTLVRGVLDPSFSRFGGGLCIPYETATVSDYLGRLSNCGALPIADCRKAQAQLVAGRMVFYGASVTAVHDEITSPVVGNVPGVAVHAAVATNLLEFGADYVREPPVAVWTYTWSQIVELALVFVWLMSVALIGRVASQQTLHRWWPRLLVGTFGVVLALAATWVMYQSWNWSPGNWLALCVALATLVPYSSENAETA
ncbi:MAG: CHASE2 domain-containing protein [Hyphomicrobiaceae bacterium]